MVSSSVRTVPSLCYSLATSTFCPIAPYRLLIKHLLPLALCFSSAGRPEEVFFVSQGEITVSRDSSLSTHLCTLSPPHMIEGSGLVLFFSLVIKDIRAAHKRYQDISNSKNHACNIRTWNFFVY